TFLEPHTAAVRVLAQGLLDLHLLQGSLDSVLETEAYKRFYMHRTSHWLGRDVHDAGDYKHGEQWRLLEAGMMLTVEPGCYIRAADDIPLAFHNLGVRIEDDALVTPAGCDIITHDAPKTIVDIETMMAEGRHG
ncbi:MAG: M24 family metallopeptidase, partial [Sterolibacterium sp.]|nr:M24 family metallopeptidase [Sterolibacterium sp.]